MTRTFRELGETSNSSTSKSLTISSSLNVLTISFHLMENLAASTLVDSSFLYTPNPYLSCKHLTTSLNLSFKSPLTSNGNSSGIKWNWIALAKNWNHGLNCLISRISPIWENFPTNAPTKDVKMEYHIWVSMKYTRIICAHINPTEIQLL